MSKITFIVILFIVTVSITSFARGGHGGGRGGGKTIHHTESIVTTTHVATPKIVVPKATTHVKTYVKPSTGKVVQAHDRTAPNKTQKDNWSSKPNVNPETGKPGTKNPVVPKSGQIIRKNPF
jgi:hypothetical protein